MQLVGKFLPDAQCRRSSEGQESKKVLVDKKSRFPNWVSSPASSVVLLAMRWLFISFGL